MGRFWDRRPATLFRGSELPRLMTMVVMLAVLYMLMGRAKDPRTWSWFAQDDSKPQEVAESGEPAAPANDSQQGSQTPSGTDRQGSNSPPAPAEAQPEPEFYGPTDQDPEEREAIAEEFQAITDNAPLTKAEMPAYARLIHWTQNQSARQMLRRARSDVRYLQLFERPDRYRGELIRLKLNISRVLKHEEVEEELLGVSELYEPMGWNEDSQPYHYILICPELPPGMPIGPKVDEQATFVGYFFKQIPYEDREAKYRRVPALIGRLVWKPKPNGGQTARPNDDGPWPWIIAAGLIALFVVRWGFLRRTGRSASKTTRVLRPPRGDDPETVPIETWLEQADSSEPPQEIKEAPKPDNNGNGTAQHFLDGLDWSDDRKR